MINVMVDPSFRCSYLVNIWRLVRPYRKITLIVCLLTLTVHLLITDLTFVTHSIRWKRKLNMRLAPCPQSPDGLEGRQDIETDVLGYKELEMLMPYMKGGRWKPEHCVAKQKIAVIVPYRDREPQLKGFLLNILPKLKRQQLDFTIYIIEQEPGERFNRGMMRNVGFLVADKTSQYDCYLMHDVDIIPEDDRNFYICGDQPRHLTSLMDRHNYTLLYTGLVGGVIAFKREQIIKMNGYSNQFFVWGGEDDELYRRILLNKYTVERPYLNHSHTSGLSHDKSLKEDERLEVLHSIGNIWKEDGISNMKYKILKQEDRQLFRWFYIRINETEIIKDRIKNPKAIEQLQTYKKKKILIEKRKRRRSQHGTH